MNNKIDLKKYHFVNLPKKFEKSDYQEVCDLIVNHLKDNSDIKSVYLSSGVWIPGISDLDIIIIHHKKRKEIPIPNFREISEKAKYVLLHGFWELAEECFKNVNYISPGLRLKLLYGEEILRYEPEKELNLKEHHFFLSGIIFEYLINKLLLFPRYLRKTQLNVRQLLGEIYSLTYTLEVFEIINPGAIKTDFPQRIRQLRGTWFNNPPEKNLRELINLLIKSIDLISELTLGLSEFVKKENLPMKSLVFENRKYYIIFNEKWTQEKFINNFEKGYISLKKPFSSRVLESFKLVLPSSLSYFFLAYVQEQGPLSNWIIKSLNDYPKTIFLINRGLKKHIKIINQSYQTTIDYGFSRVPFSYGSLVGKQTKISRLSDKLILFLTRIKK